jgi:hypothetical protein
VVRGGTESERRGSSPQLGPQVHQEGGLSYPLDFYHWAHHDKGSCSVIAGLPHVHPPWPCYLRRNLPTST